jgi:hypothetical protein
MSGDYQAQLNTCLLFRQDKEGNEKRPDYAGEIEMEGCGSFSVALWGKRDRHGKIYLALRLTRRKARAGSPAPAEASTPKANAPRASTGWTSASRNMTYNELGEPNDLPF